MQKSTKTSLKQMLGSGQLGSVNCIIVDAVLAAGIADVADELRIPLMQFHVINACGAWAMTSIRHLLENGEIPIRRTTLVSLILFQHQSGFIFYFFIFIF